MKKKEKRGSFDWKKKGKGEFCLNAVVGIRRNASLAVSFNNTVALKINHIKPSHLMIAHKQEQPKKTTLFKTKHLPLSLSLSLSFVVCLFVCLFQIACFL